jgi:prephenate dehydratase
MVVNRTLDTSTLYEMISSITFLLHYLISRTLMIVGWILQLINHCLVPPEELEFSKDESIQVISNLQRTKQLYLSLVRNAQKEILLIFPTTNAIRRGANLFGSNSKSMGGEARQP